MSVNPIDSLSGNVGTNFGLPYLPKAIKRSFVIVIDIFGVVRFLPFHFL